MAPIHLYYRYCVCIVEVIKQMPSVSQPCLEGGAVALTGALGLQGHLSCACSLFTLQSSFLLHLLPFHLSNFIVFCCSSSFLLILSTHSTLDFFSLLLFFYYPFLIFHSSLLYPALAFSRPLLLCPPLGLSHCSVLL